MSGCFNCPLMCGADRLSGRIGACGAGRHTYVARAARHYFEEPPISGTKGSGAIFFTGCNMRCVFCQNHNISVGGSGKSAGETVCDAYELASVMLRMQELGAHNVNLVTPTPHIDTIAKAIPIARKAGLTVPIVYNTNGYERAESLKRLSGLIEVYLPDLKYVSPALSQRYSGRADYFEYALPALLEMQWQVGSLRCDDNGIAVQGLIVRHLVLPAAVDETRRVLDVIKASLPEGTYVSLMSQYTPIEGMKKPLDRRLTKAEYGRAVDYAISIGMTNVFIQKLSSADSAYTPDFDGYFE